MHALWLHFLTERRVRTYPAVAALVLVATGVLLTLSSPRPWWTVWGADFRAFYAAGAFLRTDRAELLYDIPAQRSFQALVGGEGEVSIWLSPPFVAWFFVPLSALPFPVAFALHVVLSIAAGGAAFLLLGRALGRPSSTEMARAAALFYPTLQCLSEGQLSSFSLLLMAAFFVQLRRGRDGWAGALLGCLAYKPQLALGLWAALIGARRFRALGAALGLTLACAALSWTTLPGPTRAYVARAPELGAVLREPGYPTAGLHGLFQLATLLLDAFSPLAGTLLGATFTLLALAALVALWAQRPWNPATPDWDRTMAATLALCVITSPHLFGYDLMLLLVPFAIVWHLHPGGTAGRPLDGGPLLAATALVWALALVGPAITVAEQTLTRWAFGRAFALQIGVVAIAAWSWVVARRSAVTLS